jgi:hypothetical protein
MSIRNSIANCRKPIAAGADRLAFYSPKYNLVYKMRIPGREKSYHVDQTLNEIDFFNKMCESDKEVFPMVGYEYVKGKPVIIMKKCNPIENITPEVFNCDYYGDEFIEDIGDVVCANEYSVNHVRFFIDDYNLSDIHIGNLALDDNNNLVIIDVGL